VVRDVDHEVNFPSTILADALALNLIFEAHCFVYLETFLLATSPSPFHEHIHFYPRLHYVPQSNTEAYT
jgi:hypothetical protein